MSEPRTSDRDIPDSGWYPETRRPPRTVELAANLLCINGGLGLLGGFYGLAAYSLSTVGLAVALLVLILAAMQIRAGVLVRQLVPWGRSAGIVLSVVAVLLSLPVAGRGVVFFAVALLLSGATIALLLHRDTLRVFPPTRQASGR
jgi:hypothetical protein